MRGKKVLIMGLGNLGGGVASTRWFLKQGATVTVTDLKGEDELSQSIDALNDDARLIRFVLGKHKENDFRETDLVVVNPGVPKESRFLKIARDSGVEITNDARIFFSIVRNPIIAVSGTRGKTTTTRFIAHLLKSRWANIQVAGNTPENPLLKIIDFLDECPEVPVVVELSSWQLELLGKGVRAPDIAILTNIYEDHMNRYSSMDEYEEAKANIFINQTNKQCVIFNDATKKRKVLDNLLEGSNSQKLNATTTLTTQDDLGWAFDDGHKKEMLVSKKDIDAYINPLGEHNVCNFSYALLASILASRKFGTMQSINSIDISSALPTLSDALPKFRQEIILTRDKTIIVNDSTATSPTATTMALKRFGDEAIKKNLPLFFIFGGTDKNLSYKTLADDFYNMFNKLSKHFGFHLFFLEGDATDKMIQEFKKYPISIPLYKNLELLLTDIKNLIDEKGGGIVVFSPGSSSFGMFNNEFDRGIKFNAFVKKIWV